MHRWFTLGITWWFHFCLLKEIVWLEWGPLEILFEWILFWLFFWNRLLLQTRSFRRLRGLLSCIFLLSRLTYVYRFFSLFFFFLLLFFSRWWVNQSLSDLRHFPFTNELVPCDTLELSYFRHFQLRNVELWLVVLFCVFLRWRCFCWWLPTLLCFFLS